MRRVLNIRVLLLLILIISCLGVGVFFFHKWQMKRQIEIYLRKAEQAVAVKEPQKAREYFERYLLLQPNNTDALNRYAFLLDDSATSFAEKSRAYLTLERALRQYSNQKNNNEMIPPELYRRAASRAFDLKRFRDALIHLEPLLKVTPQAIELQQMQADCKFALGQYDEAKKDFEKILATSTQQINSYKALAEIHLIKQQNEEAEACLKQMVELNPKSLEARLVLIKFYRERGRLDDAAKQNDIAQSLIKTQTADPADKAKADLLCESAQLALSQRNPDDKAQAQNKNAEALQIYSQGISQFPKDVRFYIGKAQLELPNGQQGKVAALEIARQAVSLVGIDPDDQLNVAKLLLDAGDRPQATRMITDLRTRYGATPVLEYLRARLLYDEGKIGEAVSIQERIKDVLFRYPRLAIESDLLLTTAYQQLDNPDRRLAAFERILKLNSSFHEAQVGKADTLVSMGRAPEAIEIYRKQLEYVPTIRLPLIRLLIAAESRKPEQQRNWSEVNTLMSNCSAETKKSKDYALLSFQLLSSMGKKTELVKAVDQACKDNPKEMAYWLIKVSSVNQRADLDDKSKANLVEQTLQEAERAIGDNVEIRLAKAVKCLTLPREKALTALEALERNIDQWNPTSLTFLQLGLANVYFSFGMNKDGKRLLNKVLEANPSNYAVLQVLVGISIEEKNDAETLRLINVLHDLEGEEGYRWRLCSVNHLLARLQNGERSVLLEARKLLEELGKLRPSWNQVTVAQAKLLEFNGQIDQAIEQYKRAIEQGARSPDMVKKTVQMLTARRRPEEAKEVLKLVMNQESLDTTYGKLATEALQSTDTPAQTLAKAKQAVAANSKDFRDFLWLGNMHWAAEDKAGAEAAFRKAVDLGKDQPEAWANWLVYLIKMERKDEAARELKAAEALLKDKMTYVLTAYYQALDLRDKAEEQYLKLVDNNTKDPAYLQGLVGFYFRNGDFAKAEALLKKQIESPLHDVPTLSWARRNYALTLAAKPDYLAYKEALSLVEKNLKENSASPEDIRTRALILSTRPGQRKEAIKDLESSFALLKPSPNEAVLLAQLYEDEDDWPKAKAILDEMVLSKEGVSPNFRAYYILAMLRHNELTPAETQMKELEAKAKGQPIIVEPKVRLLVAQKKSTEAVDFLESQANHLFNNSKDPSVFLSASNLLQATDQKQAAEKMARKFVAEASAKFPSAILSLVELFARQGRTAEAVQICDESWGKLPVGNVATACVAALNMGKASSSELQRVETKLQAELKTKFDVSIAIALADLYNLQKRSADSEALYRKILEQQKDHPVALNNLAWQLSERPQAFDEAVQLITKAIDRYGPEGAFLDTRGMIFLRNEKITQALDDLTEAVTRASTAGHWLHLAYAQQKARNTASAEKSWKKAKTLGLAVGSLSPTDQGYYRELDRTYKP